MRTVPLLAFVGLLAAGGFACPGADAPAHSPGSGGSPDAGASGAADASAAADAGAAGDAGVDATAKDAAIPLDGGADGAARDGAVADGARPDAGSDGGQPDAGTVTCNLTGSATSTTPRVYVIGDSTASVYDSSLSPRMGWAQPLQEFFAPACATILDKALSGRSSKSFYDEGSWTAIRNALRAGDTVLIQFGHNDEKTSDPVRGTDPYTTYQQYLSKYIDEARAKGATPILLTSISRNNWSGGVLQDTHGDYPAAMRQLAQTKKVSLVDATALTMAYFKRIGQAATALLFLILSPGQSPNYPAGVTDNTHLQETGARAVARVILADLYRQGLPPGTLAKTVPVAP